MYEGTFNRMSCLWNRIQFLDMSIANVDSQEIATNLLSATAIHPSANNVQPITDRICTEMCTWYIQRGIDLKIEQQTCIYIFNS